MLASILWQGSLPEEDEINQRKEEGYHFVEQADGFRICLPLDTTPSGNYYEDGFSTGFKKEVTLDYGAKQKNACICYGPSGWGSRVNGG